MWQGFFEIIAQQIGFLLFGLDAETVWNTESWTAVDWNAVDGVPVQVIANNFTIIIATALTIFVGWLVVKLIIWLFSLTKFWR